MDDGSYEIHRRHDLARIESVIRHQRVERQRFWDAYISDCLSVGRDEIAREKITACYREWSQSANKCLAIIADLRRCRG